MSDYTLSKGSHITPDEGRCAMEWVAYLAGEPHSDKPVCVSPLLQQFCISLNDVLPDETRQRMRPLLARTIGTAGDGLDERRSWLATDWLIREYAPAWLDLTPSLADHAATLRALPPVLAVGPLDRATVALGAARKDSAAAGAAAGDVAWAAARDVARDVAWDAAGAVAGAVAGDVARAAARDVARDVARAAARDVARDVARAALAPTVDRLQISALDLLDRMLPGEIVVVPVAADWREVVRG